MASASDSDQDVRDLALLALGCFLAQDTLNPHSIDLWLHFNMTEKLLTGTFKQKI